MSKNGIIGQIVCGLPGMETKNLRVIAEVTSRLNGNDQEVLRKQLLEVLRNPTVSTVKHSFLSQHETFVFDQLPEGINFDDFFQTGESFYIDSDFRSRIVAVATTVILTSEMSLQSFSMVKNASDKEIRSELPSGHIFYATEACCVIVGMIAQQPSGKLGHLLADGLWNILYVRGGGGEVFAVVVGWDADGRRWDVSCNRLDGHRWVAGNRVFSRNSSFSLTHLGESFCLQTFLPPSELSTDFFKLI